MSVGAQSDGSQAWQAVVRENAEDLEAALEAADTAGIDVGPVRPALESMIADAGEGVN